LAYSAFALAAAFWLQAQAAPGDTGPKPGTHKVKPPGTWAEALAGGGPGAVGNEITANGNYYKFAGAKLVYVQASGDPAWDWVTIYDGGTLTLFNQPGAPWYNKKDPDPNFLYSGVSVLNFTRSTRYATTGDPNRLDFQLTGFGDDVVFEGTYSGTPKQVDAVVSGVLDTAKITVTGAKHRTHKGAGKGSGQWEVLTYIGDYGPYDYPATPIKGGGVSFDFYPTPDRAMLLTGKHIHGDNLIGRTLSATIAIKATPGATFNYYGGSSGGFVRLYIEGVNPALCGCVPGWDPDRPDCEAQYWWSNPVNIDLAALAAGGTVTLEVPLLPENWSDRDGHMGTETVTINGITVDHTAAFYAAVANETEMGLSFGGGDNFAFGCGVNAPGTATFLLYDFDAKESSHRR
jgi:hypothetical protein